MTTQTQLSWTNFGINNNTNKSILLENGEATVFHVEFDSWVGCFKCFIRGHYASWSANLENAQKILESSHARFVERDEPTLA